GDFVSKQLDLAKIIANQAELKNEATKLYDLLQKIIIFYQLEATKKNITLSLEMKNKDIFVQVDPHALKMLLKNYISNAIKYTHQGKVTINVNAKKKNDYFDVEFKIIDTGIGMSKEAIKNLYQPFSQVHDKDQHPTIVGTGLGLFNAKKLIEKLHGKVSVVSKEGVGTTFTISFNFPAAKLEAANNLVVVPEKKRCLIM
ncbi:MAG TPA: HAMP domain-containing sensor histidine kinase, partial [Gammaproteobacteria bacterium]|nr:HAMP domain-containing sensor histidine kinase [Gammaproteobacteria bacterium]